MIKTSITSTALALSLARLAQAEAPVAFDVAEAHTRIHMAAEPVHENGMPAHGNAFVSQGYIYPVGTLANGAVSRQTFAFNDGATVVTQGTEIADIGQPNLRPVTGATGDYSDIEGGLIQTTLGFNDFWGLSATYSFETSAIN